MTPAARVQAAIELLDAIIAAARDGGAAADTLIARYFKDRRYAGSKDRAAIREWVYAAIRACAEPPVTGRAAMLALAEGDPALAACFDGSTHGPKEMAAGETVAAKGDVPEWIAPRMSPLVSPEEWPAMLDRAPLDIRINPMRADVDRVKVAFPEGQAIAGLPLALRLPTGSRVENSDLYKAGAIEVQDAGSQAIARLCAARPGEIAIDLCAGAGGKTLALAADMQGRGTLLACDIVRDRLSRLPERAERAGCAAMVETCLLDPGREVERLAPHIGRADLVLVDAPCSGTGTWRRNPEARWRLTPERLRQLTQQQARILDIAATLVRPGGRLIYAVCSLLAEEGAGQVDAFTARWKEFGYLRHGCEFGRPDGTGYLLSPGHDGTDGFFMAAMEKA